MISTEMRPYFLPDAERPMVILSMTQMRLHPDYPIHSHEELPLTTINIKIYSR